ncbi:unnamed protein product [Closterium sp. NIES-65]|nr:unnamed protein product [Closterium sp. NIES-65]
MFSGSYITNLCNLLVMVYLLPFHVLMPGLIVFILINRRIVIRVVLRPVKLRPYIWNDPQQVVLLPIPLERPSTPSIGLSGVDCTGVIERPCTERARVSHSCRRIGAEVVRPTGTERGANVGLNVPAVEVRFEDVNAEAGVYVGMRALPTFLNFTRNSLAAALRSLRVVPDSRRPYPILHGCSGVLRPGRMTLLLGRPGASKSTLMQVPAGCPDKSLKVSGSANYNGYVFSEFVPERTVVCMPQNDKHIGKMTVWETLDFAAHLQGRWLRKDLVAELEKREGEQGIVPYPTMDAITKAMALEGNPTNVITDYVLKVRMVVR